jgi:hypothetical protein
MADAWYDEVTNSGFSLFGWCLWGHCGDAYSRDGRQVNGAMVNSMSADRGVVSWGNDSAHVDEADAALVAWHGSESGNVYQGSMRVNEAGAGDCTLRRDEMRVGNWDLEFLHVSSCQSMDDNQWASWWQAFGGAHQIDGFHGLMWIGSGLAGDYSDFADDAFDETIADAWLDNLYRPDISGSDDQCPVAYAVGASSADTWSRIGSPPTTRPRHSSRSCPWRGSSGPRLPRSRTSGSTPRWERALPPARPARGTPSRCTGACCSPARWAT